MVLKKKKITENRISKISIRNFFPSRFMVAGCLILVTILIGSCEKDVTVEIPRVESKVVVEGYIETGKNPFVILSNSLPFFGSIYTTDLIDNTIKGATVTVSDGSITDTLRDILNIGVYFSTSPGMQGQPGKTYSLRVVTNGITLTSVTSIPHPVPLDSAWFKVDGQRDSLGFIWAHLTDPDSLGNYYRWFAQRINKYTSGPDQGKVKDSVFVSPSGSVFEDKFFNAKSFDFAYNRGSTVNSEKEDDNNVERNFFKRGDTIVVKFCSIDRAHFEFWRTEETQVRSNGNPFGSPAPAISNIEGGLGIWGGYALAYDTVIAR